MATQMQVEVILSGRQASEAQREKGRQGFRVRDKKTRETFFCWKNKLKSL